MSNIRMAKLLVPSGGLLQASAGETFSPTQFGLSLLLPAIFVASRSPSLKLVDDNVNTPCAPAFWAPHRAPKATVKARIELFLNMTLPFLLAFSVVGTDIIRRSPRRRIVRSPSTLHPSKHSRFHDEVSGIPSPSAPRKCRADAPAAPSSRR